MKFKKILFIFIGLFFICGCATTYNPVTAKNEFILISTSNEVGLGRSIAKQISLEKKIIKEGRQKERVEKIGKRIASLSDRKDLEYNFFLIQDKEMNAFAVPGGFIYIHSALAEQANDDELACVIAHEVVHVAARHSVKQLQASLGYQLLISVALGGSDKGSVQEITNMVFSLSQLGYSRQDETLADKVGVKYSYLAGFDPQGMIGFFNRLKAEAEKQGGTLQIEIFSSHPNLDNRIKVVGEEIKRLKAFGR